MDTVISTLSAAIEARKNCAGSENGTFDSQGKQDWFEKWNERIAQLVDFLPSGCGWDCGTKIDLDSSHGEKIVLYGSFHHMNDGGYYDGWTEHTITVTPGFRSLNLRISGRNRNDIKDYLYETFDYALTRPVVWNKETENYQLAA